MSTTPIDESRIEAFAGEVLGDLAGTMTTVLAAIGDDLGLFKALASQGPAGSEELARRTGTNERYVREWLAAMNAAGYLTFDATGSRYELPEWHVPVLAQEAGPAFMGGALQMILGFLGAADATRAAFRSGVGTPQEAYPAETYDGIDRFTAGWHENLLLQQWLPSVPSVLAKLEAGTTFADVGCGRGRALIRLAQAFPASRFDGFDVHEPSIEAARKLAAEAGVADRIQFHVRDASKGLPQSYGVVSTFDVIHDAADPESLLRSIRNALEPDGVYICLDINCEPESHKNTGPIATVFYGCSILYCMTTAIAGGGEGLGTCGLSEPVLRTLATAQGFSSVKRAEMENPFNSLYELR